MLGGTVVKNGPLELIQFPGVYIMLRKVDAAAPPAGAIVNHFGFIVKDMKAALARWKAAGVRIEPTENPNEVYVVGSRRRARRGLRRAGAADARGHEPHPLLSGTPTLRPSRRWYVQGVRRQPGAPAVRRLHLQAAHDRGRRHAGREPVVLARRAPCRCPRKGRAIDHIGFEVADLDAFVASLEAKGIAIEAPVRHGAQHAREDRVPDRSVWAPTSSSPKASHRSSGGRMPSPALRGAARGPRRVRSRRARYNRWMCTSRAAYRRSMGSVDEPL